MSEIWISGNQRSDPTIRIDWSNDYHFAFQIRSSLDKHELASELRRIADRIQRDVNI